MLDLCSVRYCIGPQQGHQGKVEGLELGDDEVVV